MPIPTAQALIFERIGKVPKTHHGLHAQFSRLARNETDISVELPACSSVARGIARLWPRLPAMYFVIRKIAASGCYHRIMITLIFALAVRFVPRVFGAVAARPAQFPAVSLPGPAAGKMVSLSARLENLAQPLGKLGNVGPSGPILGLKRKTSLLSRYWQGNSRQVIGH